MRARNLAGSLGLLPERRRRSSSSGPEREAEVWGRVAMTAAWRTTTLLVVVVLLLPPAARVLANTEGDVLHSLRTNLTDPNNVLKTWNRTDVNPCQWFHVTCNNDNSVIRVDLGNAGLSGTLVPQLGKLKNLQYLELFNNNIGGTIPSELGNLINLVSLDLYLNNFTGPIPNSLGNLLKLQYLRLNNNHLFGSIPQSLTNISTLQVMDMSNNNLSGEVPSTGSFSLFNATSFANNPNLCGPSTTKPCPGSLPFSPPPPYNPSGTSSGTRANSHGVASVVALLFVVPTIGFAY